MNAIERRFFPPLSEHFPQLFSRWILESNLKELGSAPSGVPGLKVDKLNSELQVQQLIAPKQESSPSPYSSSSCRSLFASPPRVSSLSISSSYLFSLSRPWPATALAVGAPPSPAWRGPALNGLGAVSPCIFNGHACRAGVWA